MIYTRHFRSMSCDLILKHKLINIFFINYFFSCSKKFFPRGKHPVGHKNKIMFSFTFKERKRNLEIDDGDGEKKIK